MVQSITETMAGTRGPVEMSDWWEELFDERYFQFYEKLADAGPAMDDAQFVQRALSLDAGSHVLDLGCGQGRHAVAFALLGHHVTGLDLSPFLLNQAGKLAARRGAEITWIRRDMRNTDGLGPFDCCVSLCTAFGYFADAEDQKVLDGMYAVLKPGGKILMELDNPFPLLQRMDLDMWTESPVQVTRARMVFDPITARRNTTRTLRPTEGGVRSLPQSSVRMYFPHEVKKMLEQCGFETEGLFGAMADEPYDWQHSPRMVWTAAKPAQTRPEDHDSPSRRPPPVEGSRP